MAPQEIEFFEFFRDALKGKIDPLVIDRDAIVDINEAGETVKEQRKPFNDLLRDLNAQYDRCNGIIDDLTEFT